MRNIVLYQKGHLIIRYLVDYTKYMNLVDNKLAINNELETINSLFKTQSEMWFTLQNNNN